MFNSELDMATRMLGVAEYRTTQDLTPFVVEHQIPRKLVNGLALVTLGGVFEINPSVASYGVIVDALAQSALNKIQRSTTRDDYDSLEELIRTLRDSNQMVMDHLVSNSTKDLAFLGLLEGSKGWVSKGDQAWLQNVASSGISRVRNFTDRQIAANRPFRGF